MSEPGLAERLNRSCRCIAVDRDALAHRLESGPDTAGLYRSICANQPHLFASQPVFVSRTHADAMRDVVATVERVLALPAVRDAVLSWAPDIARLAHGADGSDGPRGVFLGYDFHVGPAGPQLIEINTNAGGALLNAALGAALEACCPEVEVVMAAVLAGESPGFGAFEDEVVAMFRSEWRRARGDAPLARIAIVDDEPRAQYLHPEFLLFRELFGRAGLAAVVADPAELERRDGRLWCAGAPVDLVYNRLTDFALAEPRNAAVREAYVADEAVVTPHPRAHALYADKRNLTILSDPETLARLGVDGEDAALLARSVPRTVVVDPARADELWAERRRWFFKPVDGFGSQAAYRGDKLTRGTWKSILERPYVAQRVVPPSARTIEIDGREQELKLDLRNYAYAGTVQLVAARLYRGQTTNFRTPGGGFAPVLTERAAS